MDSPVRKMQKRNDYNRHKLLRKIKRRRLREQELLEHVAEKKLKKKLKIPKYEDGKDNFTWYTLLNPELLRLNGETGDWLVLDENGNPIVNNGGYKLPDLVVRGQRKAGGYRSAYNKDDARRGMELLAAGASLPLLAEQIGWNTVGRGIGKGLELFGNTFRPSTWLNPITTKPLLSGTKGLIADALIDSSLVAEGVNGLYNLSENGSLGFNAETALNTMMLAPLAKPTVEMAKTTLPSKLSTLDYIGNKLYKYLLERDLKNQSIGKRLNGYKYDIEELIPGKTVFEIPLDAETTTELKFLPLIQKNVTTYKNPEELYQGRNNPVVFTLENGLMFVKHNSGNKPILIKPQFKQTQNSHLKISDIVDENGNIDTGNAISALRAFVDDYNVNLRSAQHRHERSFVDGQTIVPRTHSTLRHLYESAKTAQSAPVAKGSTRQNQVFNALTHDIGELLNNRQLESSYLHALRSAGILGRMFDGIPRRDLDAISRHMDKNKPFSNNPILQALALSDNASGRTYEDYIKDFPMLGYAKQDPIRNKGFEDGISSRDVVKDRINPVLAMYGYDPIPLDIPENEQRELLKQTILLHRTFLRGVSDPQHTKGNAEKIEYLNNVKNLTKAYFNTDNPSKEQLIQYAATHITPRKSFKGTMGLGGFSKFLHSDLDDAVYNSNSLDVSSGYAGKTGESAWVSLDPPKFTDDMSMAEMWEAGDFPLYEEAKFKSGTRRPLMASDLYNYEIPYRLHTGRNLKSDILEKFGDEIEKLIPPFHYRPLFKPTILTHSEELFPTLDNHGQLVYAPLLFEANDLERSILKQINSVNERFKELYPNSKFLIKPDEHGRLLHTDVAREVYDNLRMSDKLIDAISNKTYPQLFQKVIDLLSYLISSFKDSGKFSKKLLDYIFNIINEVHDASVNGSKYTKSEFKRKQLDKHLSVLKDFLKEFQYALKSYYFNRILQQKNKEKQMYAVYKNSQANELVHTYYEQMLKNAGIKPMYQLDAVQLQPIMFTTEKLRPNLRKNQETALKQRDKRFNKTNNRFNWFANKSYLHYVMLAPPNKKVSNFIKFEPLSQEEKPHLTSAHIGRRHPEASYKVK